MHELEEHLNIKPPKWRVTLKVKAFFLSLAFLGMALMLTIIWHRKSLERNFLKEDTFKAVLHANTNLPNIRLIDKDGKNFLLSDVKEKYLLINFWTSYCQACLAEMPHLDFLYKKNGHELLVITICADEDNKDFLSYLSKFNPQMPSFWLADRQALTSLSINKFPETFLVNKDGKVLLQFSGYRDYSQVKMIEFLRKKIAS